MNQFGHANGCNPLAHHLTTYCPFPTVRSMRTVTPLKLAVVASGRRQKDIAAQIGMDEAGFSRIVNGLHTSEATRERIAQALGRTPADLWPDANTEAAA